MSTPERWHWKFPAKDRLGRDRTLGVGAEDGFVIFALLDDAGAILEFFKADPSESDGLVPAIGVASDWARSQRREP